MASVVSPAIIEGSLIIGLSDGSIINAGYVQGPQGLRGEKGPMGNTGLSGNDGNTIHTVKGPPPTDLGREGDYAINNRDWFFGSIGCPAPQSPEALGPNMNQSRLLIA